MKKSRLSANFSDEQKASISTTEQKDKIMQNIKVLMKTARRDADVASATETRLEKQIDKLNREIKNYDAELHEIKVKEEKM